MCWADQARPDQLLHSPDAGVDTSWLAEYNVSGICLSLLLTYGGGKPFPSGREGLGSEDSHRQQDGLSKWEEPPGTSIGSYSLYSLHGSIAGLMTEAISQQPAQCV